MKPKETQMGELVQDRGGGCGMTDNEHGILDFCADWINLYKPGVPVLKSQGTGKGANVSGREY